MERFKSTQGPVRLASTTGKVVIVGDTFVDVPDELVSTALSYRLIPESLYQEAVVKETEVDEERRRKIIAKAVAAVNDMVADGEEMTDGGEALVYHGKPRVGAVSEIAGFKVGAAEIEECLQ